MNNKEMLFSESCQSIYLDRHSNCCAETENIKNETPWHICLCGDGDAYVSQNLKYINI